MRSGSDVDTKVLDRRMDLLGCPIDPGCGRPMGGNRTGTVAVVDDDPAVLDSLRFLLEVLGCDVATYASALTYLDDPAAHPACMIVDQHMPRMTGLELAQRLRDDGRLIPMLLITGSPS